MAQNSPTKRCDSPGCGKPVRARGLCSTHYNNTHQPNRHAAKLTACAVCGTAIARAAKTGRRPVCSTDCRAIVTFGHTASTPPYSWKTFAARRARAACATVVEPFDREAVFERDDWTCYLCHLPVDRAASAFDPASATVDHVQPLSHGGEHTMRNARTAHLHCNSAKQDQVPAARA